MKLLIIDDNTESVEALRDLFAAEAFHVQTASDGEEGLQAARAGVFDLVLLDVNLPKRDGFSVVESLRKAGNETAVIFLTRRDSVQDRVHGLSLGSDDYVVKPFVPAELLARIKSVLRRTRAATPQADWKSSGNSLIRIGDLELDLIRNRAVRAGRQLKLTPKEFALLSLLARQHGQVLSRSVIAEQVWDAKLESGTNVVDVHVRRLRAKVDDPFDYKMVHTIRGAGYVLKNGGKC